MLNSQNAEAAQPTLLAAGWVSQHWAKPRGPSGSSRSFFSVARIQYNGDTFWGQSKWQLEGKKLALGKCVLEGVLSGAETILVAGGPPVLHCEPRL